MKTLKRAFGNPLIVAHSRLCSIFDKAQIKANSNLVDGSINLLVFETWLDDQIKVCFIPLADIVNKQDEANRSTLSLHEVANRSNTNVLETSQKTPDSSALEFKGNISTIVENSKIQFFLKRKNKLKV